MPPMIAIENGFPVGAAWYRLFTAERPGYGFVDEATPELAIAVVPSARGKGVGGALLDALLARAAEEGHAAISLSVDRTNARAIELYEPTRLRARRASRTTRSRCSRARRQHLTMQRRTKGRERMDVDVAVLGGGPAGYTAAIRAAQLGGKVVCVEQEPALGGTCLRVGCIPTKAWVQSAHALHDARETFAKLGVQVGEPTLDFAGGGGLEGRRRRPDDRRRSPRSSRRTASSGSRAAGASPGRTRSPSRGTRTSRSAARSWRPAPRRCGRRSRASTRRGSSTRPGLLAQTEVPRRLVVLGGGIIGCEFASIFNRFGSEVTIVEMLPTLIPHGGRRRRARSSRRRSRSAGSHVHLGKQCTAVEDHGSAPRRALRRGRERRGRPDARLRRARGGRRRARARGRRVSRSSRRRIPTDDAPAHERAAHLRGRRRRRLLAARAHRASARARSPPRTRWATRPRSVEPAVPRPIYTDPEIAGRRPHRGGRRASATGTTNVVVGRCPWAAIARAVMSGNTTGWVKTIHEATYGELLGVVIVGPHATDLIGEAVVALDAESTIETIADGIAPHPTLAEAAQGGGARRARPRDPPAAAAALGRVERQRRLTGAGRSGGPALDAIPPGPPIPQPGGAGGGARRRAGRQPLAQRGAVRAVPGRARGDRARSTPGLNRYPSRGSHDLTHALAARLGVPPARGRRRRRRRRGDRLRLTQAGLEPGDEAVVPWPSFPSFVRDTQKRGAHARDRPAARRRRRPRRDARGGRPSDAARVRRDAEQPDRDARRCRATSCAAFVDALPEHVLAGGRRGLPRVPRAGLAATRSPTCYQQGRRVLVIRTFSKMYGLAGCASATAIGPADVSTRSARCSAGTT